MLLLQFFVALIDDVECFVVSDVAAIVIVLFVVDATFVIAAVINFVIGDVFNATFLFNA